MSGLALWGTILAMGVVTWALRASFVMLGDAGLPPLLRRALAYVPQAVLAALVAPALFAPSGATVGPVDVRLVAGVLALVVAWRTKHVLPTLAAGMGVLWTLTWLAQRGT